MLLIFTCRITCVEFDFSDLLNDFKYNKTGLPKYVEMAHIAGFHTNLSFPPNILIVFDKWKDANISVFGRKLRTDAVRYEFLGPFNDRSELRAIYFPGYPFTIEINSTSTYEQYISFSVFMINSTIKNVYIHTENVNENIKNKNGVAIVSPTVGNKSIQITSETEFEHFERNNFQAMDFGNHDLNFGDYHINLFEFSPSNGKTIKFKLNIVENNNNKNSVNRLIDISEYPLIYSDYHLFIRKVMLYMTLGWTSLILLVSLIAFIRLLNK